MHTIFQLEDLEILLMDEEDLCIEEVTAIMKFITTIGFKNFTLFLIETIKDVQLDMNDEDSLAMGATIFNMMGKRYPLQTGSILNTPEKVHGIMYVIGELTGMLSRYANFLIDIEEETGKKQDVRITNIVITDKKAIKKILDKGIMVKFDLGLL